MNIFAMRPLNFGYFGYGILSYNNQIDLLNFMNDLNFLYIYLIILNYITEQTARNNY